MCTLLLYVLHPLRTKKVSVPAGVFGQIVGKNSCNLNAIKQGTNTQIEIDKVSKQVANRSLTVRSVHQYLYVGLTHRLIYITASVYGALGGSACCTVDL